jgi:N-methylhydantoinase A
MLAADVVKDYVQTVMRPGDTPFAELERLIAPLAAQGQAEVLAEGVPAGSIALERLLDMRYRGQSYELPLPLTPDFADAFHAEHARVYGHSEAGTPLEIVNLRLRVIGQLPKPPLPAFEAADTTAPQPFDRRPVVLAAGMGITPFYRGDALQPGQRLDGPAVVVQPDTTVFLDAGQGLQVDGYKNLILHT